MTVFWLWVGVGCLACALLGFSAVRVGARFLSPAPVTAATPLLERHIPRKPRALVVVPTASAPAMQVDPEPQPFPVPTTPRPGTEQLVFWASQVKEGERKMSIATDGCRVTWNRTCKHGHPTWLVYLGYL